jgi:acyl-coenzyme A thioesterase 9
VNVPPLKIETEEERRLFREGEENYKSKKAMLQTALRKQTPNDEESDLIHAMWLKQLEYHDPNNPCQKPDNVLYMDSTKLHSAQIMQPQYRNRHNFMIFGGFLLKQTFELAFCCAASFSHTRPTFISLDPSTFDNPVPVGSVLYLTATVVYTDPPLVCSGNEAPNTSGQTRVQVRVDSKVRDVQHGETKPTGQFNYTFLIEKDLKTMPKTYSEFMMWVDARRRAMKVAAATSAADANSSLSNSSTVGTNQERITE